MSKKRKQKLTIWDLGRIERTPVAQPTGDAIPAGTLKQFREREQARENQEAATRQAEIERVQKDTSRLMAECLSVSAPLQSKFWSSSLENIKAHLHDDENFDNLFLPTREYSPDDKKPIYDAIQQFLDGVVFEQGYALGDTSRRRFGYYVASQVNAGVSVDSASLAVMFKRCFDLSIFKNDDSEFVEHFQTKTPAKQPRVEPVEQPRRESLEDFESFDTTNTRDGVRRARNLAENLMIEEMLPVATAWVESIQRAWNFSPTPEDLKRVSTWIERNNLNRLSPKTYDAARRWMCANSFWPPTILTAVEALDIEVEKMDFTRMSFDERRVLNIRRQAARESDIARFGHAQ